VNNFLLLILIVSGSYWFFREDSLKVKGVEGESEFSYILHVTQGDKKKSKLAMIVALHGNGDTPSAFYDTFMKGFPRPARIILIKGPIKYNGGRIGGSAWPIRKSSETKKTGEEIHQIIETLRYRYPTISDPIVLGFSGGAVMSYYLAANYPSSYSYISPLSGLLDLNLFSNEELEPDTSTKVIAFHGKSDSVLHFQNAKQTADKLGELGLYVEFNDFEGGHTGAFTVAKEEIFQKLEEAVDDLVSR
jgi:phospholipase/carboxylesterase